MFVNKQKTEALYCISQCYIIRRYCDICWHMHTVTKRYACLVFFRLCLQLELISLFAEFILFSVRILYSAPLLSFFSPIALAMPVCSSPINCMRGFISNFRFLFWAVQWTHEATERLRKRNIQNISRVLTFQNNALSEWTAMMRGSETAKTAQSSTKLPSHEKNNAGLATKHARFRSFVGFTTVLPNNFLKTCFKARHMFKSP